MENNVRPAQVFDFQIYPMLEPELLLKRGEGRNGKKLLIVLVKLAEEERTECMELLAKIMKAINVDLAEDAFLLELEASESFHFLSLHRQLEVECMISFGLSPNAMGLHFNHQSYVPTTFMQWQFLLADALPDIAGTQALKGALWAALQKMFL